MTGKSLRMGRIFRADGRAVIVAMDHGMPRGPAPGLERPADLLDKVAQGGADAILTTPGIVAHFHERICGRLGVVLRCDGGSTVLKPKGSESQLIVTTSPREALRMGVDAVACMGGMGTPRESSVLANVARLAEECRHTGMPLMVEPKPPEGLNGDELLRYVSVATRVAGEYGADFVKTAYTGDAKSFAKVVEGSLVPVVILGGPPGGGELGLLQAVRDAVDAGGAGVAFGRNVWQHANPAGMTAALRAIVHEDASQKEAQKLI